MLAFVAAFALSAGHGPADQVPLTLIPSGAMSKFGRFLPIHLELSARRPASLKSAPPLTNPKFGMLKFGGKDHITIVDEETSGLKLYLDSNANGDLTDDPAATWQTSQYPAKNGKQYTFVRGTATIDLSVDGREVPVSLGVYKFDKSDPDHADLVDTLLYYADYGAEGQMTLDGGSYHVLLVDWESTGFLPRMGQKGQDTGSGMLIAIDINNNGKFDSRGEDFDALQPFNVGGTTYQLSKLSATNFTFAKSSKHVVAVPLPPAIGDKTPPFTAVTTDGSHVPFPGRYKGKLVMLTFWSIADEHSTREIPGLAKVYAKYHSKGFEVLGVSCYLPEGFDDPGRYAKDHNMPWLQISEHYPQNAAITNLYVVRYLPAAFLVDGDTGKIVATIDALRGDKLEPTIAKALAKMRGGR